jgi:hypothetical protein
MIECASNFHLKVFVANIIIVNRSLNKSNNVANIESPKEKEKLWRFAVLAV